MAEYEFVVNPNLEPSKAEKQRVEGEIETLTSEIAEAEKRLEEIKSQNPLDEEKFELKVHHIEELKGVLSQFKAALEVLTANVEKAEVLDANGMVRLDDVEKVDFCEISAVLVPIVISLPMRGDFETDYHGTCSGSVVGRSPHLNIEKYGPLIERAFTTESLDANIIAQIAMDKITKIVSEAEIQRRVAAQVPLLKICPEIKAVLPIVESFGGSPTEAYALSTKLQRESKKAGVPIYTFTEHGAFSGGFFVLSTGVKAFACGPFTKVGSIGVVTGYGKMTERGLKRADWHYYTETAGDKKRNSLCDPQVPASEEDLAELREDIADCHAEFIDFVKGNRGDAIKAPEDEVFNGASFRAKKAVEMGLIDGICHYEDFITREFGERALHIEVDVTDPSLDVMMKSEKGEGGDGAEVKAVRTAMPDVVQSNLAHIRQSQHDILAIK